MIGELEVDVLPVDETETDSTGNVQLNPIVSINPFFWNSDASSFDTFPVCSSLTLAPSP